MRATKAVSGVLLACIMAALVSAYGPVSPSSAGALRVCADPNNLPFSNDKQQGFENRIAKLVARDLGAKLSYVWWAQHRGFVRNTINQNQCDLLIGVPASFERTRPTIPYYRSTYVFVTRRDRHIRIESFDDPQLKRLRVGVQLIGDDGINTPPAHALSNRGIIRNVKGYSVYSDYRQPNPPARIIDAVANGDVDVAVAWGPLAGYFAQREAVPLDVRPVSPQIDHVDVAVTVRMNEDLPRLTVYRHVEQNILVDAVVIV